MGVHFTVDIIICAQAQLTFKRHALAALRFSIVSYHQKIYHGTLNMKLQTIYHLSL